MIELDDNSDLKRNSCLVFMLGGGFDPNFHSEM